MTLHISYVLHLPIWLSIPLKLKNVEITHLYILYIGREILAIIWEKCKDKLSPTHSPQTKTCFVSPLVVFLFNCPELRLMSLVRVCITEIYLHKSPAGKIKNGSNITFTQTSTKCQRNKDRIHSFIKTVDMINVKYLEVLIFFKQLLARRRRKTTFFDWRFTFSNQACKIDRWQV